MTSRARRRCTLPALALAAALTLSACGDDDIDVTGSAPNSQADTATDPGTSTGTTTGTSTVVEEPTSGTPAVAASGKDGIPDVTANAKDLKKEPTLAAGTGTPSTKLLTKDLVVGTGAVAKSTATVTVQYVGALYTDGKVFDSSWSSGPIDFPLSQVVPGFAQGIEGMKVGGRREIVIPGDLAYGPNPDPSSGIPPNATLVFVVDLVKIA